jgi:YQGE family putative transporter
MRGAAKEIAFFRSHERSMRTLLTTNFMYALTLPIIELFIGAYIIRNSYNFSLVMVFQLAQNTGIPITFMINGFLLNRYRISTLYSFGLLLSGVSMTVMMSLRELNITGVSVAGLIMGISYGFFWANRGFLALTTTRDENRNYYYGLETFLYTLSFIIIPVISGIFIAKTQQYNWFGGNTNGAYYVLTAFVFVLTIIATVLANNGGFTNPPKTKFIYFHFHRLWRKMLRLAMLKGIAQGYITTAPVMLIMRLVGDEGSIGVIQSTGSLLSAVLLYALGRKTSPQHRLNIFFAGLFLFLLGSSANMFFYSLTGVIFFIACLVFARPLLDLAYYPIQLSVIEFVSAKEKRNQFTYIFTHELGLYVGRLFGCGLFIILARYINRDFALRYALPVIALLQSASVFVAKSILKDNSWKEPAAVEMKAVDVLKDAREF